MGQKVNPLIFRIPYIFSWQSKWFANKVMYGKYVLEDYKIRLFLKKKFHYNFLEKIFIERASNKIRVKIYTLKPGIVIGRGGKELEHIRNELKKIVVFGDIIIDIQEVKNYKYNAQLISASIAGQLEKKVSFRKIMKQVVQSSILIKNVKGIRVQVSGRLGGAEIARREWVREGSIPLHTIRSKIYFGFEKASTKYGIIGVKC
jgi:small subunit ribosomal protein S3